MSLELILEFIDKKRAESYKNIGTLETLASQSASKKVSNMLSTTNADAAWEKKSKSAISKLGQDFISKQIATRSKDLINNIDTLVGGKYGDIVNANKFIKQTTEQVQSTVFDSITAAVTAKNDLAMYFIQEQAKLILINLEKKRIIAVTLQEKLRELYNILLLISNANPFFGPYLQQLRNALILIHNSKEDLTLIHNTLYSTNRWLKTRFQQVQNNLELAEALMNPPGTETDVKFAGNSLLSAAASSLSKSEQASILLALPQKIKEVLNCANGYFIITLKVNSLLLLFIQAHGAFTGASSRKIKQYTLNSLSKIIQRLDLLVAGMAVQLNGGAEFIESPKSDTVRFPDGTTDSRLFDPDPIKASSSALGWVLDLQAIMEQLRVMPGNSLQALELSNNALQKYQDACTKIKALGNRTEGDAILTAVEGREEPGQLERQLSRFLLGAMKAVKKPKEGQPILPLGKTLIKRLDLTIAQDREIESALRDFASADLGFPSVVSKAGQNIFKMLDNFGLDRAADLLRSGDYAKFFNLDGKTATYAGAAITAFSVLKECLGTTEDREQLTQAQREVERELKSKELIAQRTSATGFEQQITEVKKDGMRLDTLSERTQVSAKKCGLPTDFMPSNLIKTLGPVVGLSALGNKTIADNISKIGKGIL